MVKIKVFCSTVVMTDCFDSCKSNLEITVSIAVPIADINSMDQTMTYGYVSITPSLSATNPKAILHSYRQASVCRNNEYICGPLGGATDFGTLLRVC